MPEKLNIKELAEDDRPRERMMRWGAAQMSDAELLAILIGSGSSDETAVGLMQRVMEACHGDLNELGKWRLEDFTRFKGMGPAKSLTIMAALELGKRRKEKGVSQRTVIRSSKDVYELLHPTLGDLYTEEVWALLLNHAAKVVDKVCVGRGGIDNSAADVRVILREALIRNCTALILVHNHPSGNIRPSAEDRKLTKSLKDAAAIMKITLLDHVIITDGSYYSFADEGTL